MPHNASLHGRAVDHQMVVALVLMGVILLVAQVIMFRIWLGWRRERPDDSTPAGVAGAWLATGAFVTVSVAFIWMAITAEQLWAANRFEGASPAAMQVEVVGTQFEWYFRYPGPDAKFGRTTPALVSAAAANPIGLDRADPASADDIVSSELVLPAGREVDLQIRALDVIHGFFIPAMRLKENALPGSTLHIHFTPLVPGTYPILCTQVCGMGHYRMNANLRVVTPADFSQWLAAHAPALSSSAAQGAP